MHKTLTVALNCVIHAFKQAHDLDGTNLSKKKRLRWYKKVKGSCVYLKAVLNMLNSSVDIIIFRVHFKIL